MLVTVEYFAQAREAAGTSREMLTLPEGCTLEALLRDLASTKPKLARFLLTEGGAISSSLAVAVNDRQVRVHENSVLREGDGVLIVPAVSGG